MARTTGTIHRLLIVGDDAQSRTRTARTFSDRGYDIVGRTPAGQEAMDAAGRLRPDLVVVITEPPGTDDTLAVARAIDEFYDIPSLHVSADSQGRELGRKSPAAWSGRPPSSDAHQRLEGSTAGPAPGAATSARLLERLRQGDAVVSEKLHLQMTPGTEVVVLLCTDVVGPDEEIRWIGSEAMNAIGRVQVEPDLASLAFRDPLTGLANRRAVEEHGARYLALADRHDTHVGLIFLDLGQFRAINDRLGNPAGDAVLTEVARRLKNEARVADVVARVGGDEFLILLPDVADLDDVETVAHRMERKMVSPFEVKETEISVRADMGIALYPDHGSSLEELVRAADRALHRATKNRSGPGDGPVAALATESTPEPSPTVEDQASRTGGGAGPSQAM